MTRLLEGLTFTETEQEPSGLEKDEVFKELKQHWLENEELKRAVVQKEKESKKDTNTLKQENEVLKNENEILKQKISELEAKFGVAGTWREKELWTMTYDCSLFNSPSSSTWDLFHFYFPFEMPFK